MIGCLEEQKEMLGFDNTMMSSNHCKNMNAHSIDNDAIKASWGNAACFNKSDYRRDSLLGIASSSLFANMDSLGPMQSLHQESVARVSPLNMISEVLQELSGDDTFGRADDDFADTLALEPTPLDTSRMKIVDRLPLNRYNTRDLSLFKETISTKNNSGEPLRFSHPATTMSCLPDMSTSDSSRKRKHQLEGVVQQSKSKRQREKQQQDEEEARRFRPYQAELWTVKFAELLEFKQQKGHCCVPYTYGENPALARWVKRQRYQYKLKIEGKQSTMTDERVAALEEHGFIWDSHGAAWQERWNELAEYQELYGNCNVPSNYASNPQLATWIKCQRRQYKLYFEGKANTTTPERIAELESLGFEWELRKSSK
jgi:hypothetical protein